MRVEALVLVPGVNIIYWILTMSVWETTFNGSFFLTLAGIVFGFGGLTLRACLKSRCKEFNCFGVSCVRDAAPPGQEPDLDENNISLR